ncbi:MAG TPA: UDP-N-acetylmuramate--L-alanine ligase [Clostridiales bacterium]|nr:UDP-N-acetylmuramate--L-alanine ligase [Clostridiales bacterium]
MINFEPVQHQTQHIHFIGIGGIGMSAIAEILLQFGYKISGSDMKSSKITEKLKKQGVEIFLGHHPDHLPLCDLVIYTTAVKEDNPELVRARELNIPAISRAEALGLLMKKFANSIAVSGTHGKTTTTSMISLILEHSGFDPTILVGGELDEIGGNVKIGNSNYLVTEACEYKGNFLNLFPKIGVILNIDLDHLDYFKNIQHITDTFTKFGQLIPEDGFLIAFADDPNVQQILPYMHCNIITYGLNSNADYRAVNISLDENGFPVFDVNAQGQPLGQFHLSIPGKHNVCNALASIACCRTLGVPAEQIKKFLSVFKGTHRRFDILGIVDGITVVDDYAHHPTEVRATLAGAAKVPHNRIWSVFQPHTYTRTKALLHDFARSFAEADKIIITDIYAAREADTGIIHAKDLAEAIRKQHKDVIYNHDFHQIVEYLKKEIQPKDLILTMGAGNIYQVGQMLLESLHAEKEKVAHSS